MWIGGFKEESAKWIYRPVRNEADREQAISVPLHASRIPQTFASH
jgi:hypothetical protein